MSTSTVATLKANLKTQLAARAGLANVQIAYGAPLPDPQREFIALLGVEGDQKWAALGKLSRWEEYELKVCISVIQEAVDQQACTERCFALQAELENQLRTDPTVNGAVWVAEIDGRFKLEEYAAENSRAAQLELTVHARTKI